MALNALYKKPNFLSRRSAAEGILKRVFEMVLFRFFSFSLPNAKTNGLIDPILDKKPSGHIVIDKPTCGFR